MAADASSTPPIPVVRIEPTQGWVSLKLRELWDFREMAFFLVWRDVKVRYKQTVLGAAWAIIQPLFTMLVFSIFFGKLAKMPSDGIPYPIFSYAGLVPWNFFAQALGHSSDSLLSSANLIRKVYFPRLVIPVAAVCGGVVDFCISFSVLLIMMVIYGVPVTLRLLWLPPLLLLALVTALGVGLWLSALNIQFRDVRYTVPFITQFWMYATPVVYPSSLLSEPWRTVYGFNPMVGVIEGFRWALLGTNTAPKAMILVSAAASVLILIGGAHYFRRLEKRFADLV